MKKFFLASFPLFLLSLSYSVNDCASCHEQIAKEWSQSAHAHAHFSQNKLLDGAMKAVATKTGKPLEGVQAACMTCHSPLTASAQEVNTPLSREGVGCISCHSVADVRKTHATKPPVGKNVLAYGANDVMHGPHANAKSPFHKTAASPYFSDKSNDLCNACHKVNKNDAGITTCTTGMEYASVVSDKTCVACHMGEGVKGLSAEGGKSRILRPHTFKGSRDSEFIKTAIDLALIRQDTQLNVMITNKLPHNFPTGFPGRLMGIEVTFEGSSQLYKQILNFTLLGVDGQPTLGPLAVKEGEDKRLKPYEKRLFSFALPTNATKAKVRVFFKTVSPMLAEKLKLTDELYTKEFLVSVKELGL